MVNAETFSNSVKLETADTLRNKLSSAKDIVDLYNKAIDLLSKMERNFGNVLGNRRRDFDGKVTVGNNTEFERKAGKYNKKMLEYKDSTVTTTALYVVALAFSFGKSNVDEDLVDTLVDELLLTQQVSKRQLEKELLNNLGNSENTQQVSGSKEGDINRYEVKKGDTLSKIAQKLYGDWRLYRKIKEINGLKSDVIKVGQILKLPKNLSSSSKPETTKNTEPIIEITTNDRNIVRFSTLEDYNPLTSPQRIVVADDLQKLWVNDDIDSAANLEATDLGRLKNWVLKFLEFNPNILKETGIKDIYHLSPKEAIILASKITMRRLEFSYLQGAFGGVDAEGHVIIDSKYLNELPEAQRAKYIANPSLLQELVKKIDNMPIDQMFFVKEGVCRNYGDAVKGVFQVLKDMQEAQSSQLANTYCARINSYHSPVLRKQIVDKHLWNTFYTVNRSGGVDTLVIDATWADRDENGNLDYSSERFLFNIAKMREIGLITEAQQIAQLERWCREKKNQGSKSYSATCLFIADYYVKIGDNERAVDFYFELLDDRGMKGLYEFAREYKMLDGDVNAGMDRYIEKMKSDTKPKDNFFIDCCANQFYRKGLFREAADKIFEGESERGVSPYGEVVLIASLIQIKEFDDIDKGAFQDDLAYVLGSQGWLQKTYPNEMAVILERYGAKNNIF
ncbi:hypothetical protein A2335_05045 [Candidatus Peregrinibacteria bacterium RIFOXYB2_FULL_32_7]|nr:MAG: hypothetical protein A2335_05045 [Candidatus Peregrinibacteria bacterium RIFOXYB2_FULL_32_7]